MKANNGSRGPIVFRRGTRIKTSIMELMQELSNLTNDDSLVVAAVRSIFGAYRVRLAAAPVPLRLVNTAVRSKPYAKKTGRGKNRRLA